MPAEEKSSLTLDVRAGQTVMIDGERIAIDILDKSGKTARLRVRAPLSVSIKTTPEPDPAVAPSMLQR